MDNVCHTLVGAVCAEAGLKRWTRYGGATLMIAANLPDLDALVFATDVPSVSFRRGWTHGILAQLVLPFAFAAVMWSIGRLGPGSARGSPGVRWWPLVLLSFVGVLSHVGLDYLNNYGIRLLMPFSGRWFYGDAVFIIDPWLWVALATGIILARRHDRVKPARVALGVSMVYITVMLASATAARHLVMNAWQRDHGRPPDALMVGPFPVDPLRKAVIVDAGDHYETGTFTWLTRDVRYNAARVEKNEDAQAAAMAREDRQVQALLVWARFPYYELERHPQGTRVVVTDLRFGRFVAAITTMVP